MYWHFDTRVKRSKVNVMRLSWNSTTPTPTRTSSRESSPTRPTRSISWSYWCCKLNDTPTFSRRFSRRCRRGCRCRRRGMPALSSALPSWVCSSIWLLYVFTPLNKLYMAAIVDCWAVFGYNFCHVKRDVNIKHFVFAIIGSGAETVGFSGRL